MNITPELLQKSSLVELEVLLKLSNEEYLTAKKREASQTQLLNEAILDVHNILMQQRYIEGAISWRRVKHQKGGDKQ